MPDLILSAAEDSLIGQYVLASSSRKERAGVILPPGTRSRRLRLAQDDGPLVPLDPSWTILSHPSLMRDRRSQKVVSLEQRVKGRPTYRFGDLPARHLATKTMLREERRRQPAPDQAPIAWYSLYRSWAPLYAIADTVEMAPLSEKRSAAWHAARTCSVCEKEFGRPLPCSPAPESDRYCSVCHQLTAEQRWIESVRPVQLQMAVWAQEVLVDPRTVLAAGDGLAFMPTFQVETVTREVVLSARVRNSEDLPKGDRPERYADTVYVGDLLDQIRRIADSRIVSWYGGEIENLPNGAWKLFGGEQPRTRTANTDRLVERYRLWTGKSPSHRNGWWYPQPALPWTWVGSGSSGEHESGYRTAQTAKDRVKWMREYLRRMAFEQPPTPTISGRG